MKSACASWCPHNFGQDCTLPLQCEYEGEIIQVKPTLRKSLIRSLKTNLSITFAVFPLAVIPIILLYFDLRTSDLCFEWRSHNHSEPFGVTRLKLIGDYVQGVLLGFWFPTTMVILFGWNEFKRHYSLTLLTSLLFGLMATLYLTFLTLYNAFDANVLYRIPGNVIFAINLLVGCLYHPIWLV